MNSRIHFRFDRRSTSHDSLKIMFHLSGSQFVRTLPCVETFFWPFLYTALVGWTLAAQRSILIFLKAHPYLLHNPHSKVQTIQSALVSCPIVYSVVGYSSIPLQYQRLRRGCRHSTCCWSLNWSGVTPCMVFRCAFLAMW